MINSTGFQGPCHDLYALVLINKDFSGFMHVDLLNFYEVVLISLQWL